MTETATSPFTVIAIADLCESQTNPRRTFGDAAMAELSASIKQHGVLQPILVRPLPNGFEVIAGARRYRASKAAELASVPCVVQDLTEKEVLEVQFIENLQREDLHPLDEGVGFRQLHETHGYSVEDLAAKLVKSKAYVYSRMKLAELPAKAQKLFLDGKIEISHALLVARIPNEKLAAKAAVTIAKGDWNSTPLSYRHSVEMVRRQFQCDLSRAAFPTGDTGLVARAGACGPCPKRTGNQQDLFGDVAEKERANICTDPKCFASKVAAHWKAKKADMLQKGGKVLEGKAASDASYGSAYVDPMDRCYKDPKQRTWRQLAKGHAPTEVLLQGRDGQAVVRWERASVVKAAKANGHKFVRPERKTAAPARQSPGIDWKERRRIDDLVFDRVVPPIVAAAEGLDAADALRVIVRWMLRIVDSTPAEKRRGLRVGQHAEKIMDGLSREQLQGLAAELIALEEGSEDNVCKALGVDTKAIRSAVEAEEAAKAKSSKPKAKPKRKKAKKAKARKS